MPFITYVMYVIRPQSGSKEEEAVGDGVADFYDELNSKVFPGDVLLDDRGTVACLNSGLPKAAKAVKGLRQPPPH